MQRLRKRLLVLRELLKQSSSGDLCLAVKLLPEVVVPKERAEKSLIEKKAVIKKFTAVPEEESCCF